jgi:acyl-[acyl carrier protein]--UDP-N-acetylglucosamine O-acyltransferase
MANAVLIAGHVEIGDRACSPAPSRATTSCASAAWSTSATARHRARRRLSEGRVATACAMRALNLVGLQRAGVKDEEIERS